MPRDQVSPPNAVHQYSLSDHLEAKIANIERAGIEQMREIWRLELGGAPPPIRAYGFLKRILAWKVQERYLGGLNQTARQHLDRLVASLDRDPKGETASLRLKPGMVLIREWKGVKHQVRVMPDGFENQGITYDSLSRVARKIAGTRWSGPLFFGLKRAKKAKPK